MKLPHRRQFLHLAAGAAALSAVSRVAWAQAYPSRPCVTYALAFTIPRGAMLDGPLDRAGATSHRDHPNPAERLDTRSGLALQPKERRMGLQGSAP
jgi:hypothetical protein